MNLFFKNRFVRGFRGTCVLAPTAGLLLTISAVSRAQDWRYSHDAAGNVIARAPAGAALPQIVGQPVAQVVATGDVATFSVVLADAGGATFQWRFNDGDIPGATNDSFVVPSVSPADAGLYSVTVTNAVGSVASTGAALLIDGDSDMLPDSWELAGFGNLSQSATGDFDGDGVSNLIEFRDGTDPANNASRKVRLTVTSTGGSVLVSPARASYDAGEMVTLTAIPALPNGFRQWEGALTGTE